VDFLAVGNVLEGPAVGVSFFADCCSSREEWARKPETTESSLEGEDGGDEERLLSAAAGLFFLGDFREGSVNFCCLEATAFGPPLDPVAAFRTILCQFLSVYRVALSVGLLISLKV